MRILPPDEAAWKEVAMFRSVAVGALATLLITCSLASAQANSASDLERFNRQQQLQQYELDNRLQINGDVPISERALIDYGGYFSPQYYSIDDANNDNHGLRQYDLVAYLRANFDGANEIFLRGKLEYNDYNPGDSFDGFGSRLLNPDFDRAFYKFDLQQYQSAYHGQQIDGDVAFEGGRDLVYWGNGLTIAEVVDGFMPAFSWKNVTLQTVAGVTPTRTVDFEPDRPSFDFDTRRGFYGAMLSVAAGPVHPYVYGLIQRDYNDHNLSVIGPITTRYSYNSDYVGAGITGSLTDHVRVGIEGVYESGNGLSDSSQVEGFVLTPVPQTRDNIIAFAGDAKIDYVPQDAHNSRFTLEGIVATGDSDRGLTNTTFNGNKPGSHDRAFNGFGLVSTGLAFGAPVSNLEVVRFGASTFPLAAYTAPRRLQVGMDFYIFDKENANAPIDQATTSGAKFLGWEPDIYVNWEVASDVTLAARYGTFVPNSKAFASDSVRQFLYLGVTFAF
jgi:hypothetical protein